MTTTIITALTLNGLRDRVLADAGDAACSGLEALRALTDAELAALYHGYMRAEQEAHRGGDLHARAASYALEAAGVIDSITPEVRRLVRIELAAALR